VLEGLQLRRYVKDQHVITEGEPGASFFILAEGDVIVTRKAGEKVLNLARLAQGAVFGEMALIKQAPRTATVTALNDCDLLELSRDFLATQGNSLQSVTQALDDFTHERFLANLAATSAIFKPFPRSMRSEILKKFVHLRARSPSPSGPTARPRRSPRSKKATSSARSRSCKPPPPPPPARR
jgi:CRP-like cAMP-binding protein